MEGCTPACFNNDLGWVLKRNGGGSVWEISGSVTYPGDRHGRPPRCLTKFCTRAGVSPAGDRNPSSVFIDEFKAKTSASFGKYYASLHTPATDTVALLRNFVVLCSCWSVVL
jgi:hypothetical protein